MSLVLSPYFNQLESRPAICWQGRVTQVVGNLLESAAASLQPGGVLRSARCRRTHLLG